MSKLDQRHLETVARILEAIAAVEESTARAAVACEDAYVALRLGLIGGLTPKVIARLHDEAMADADAVH